MNPARRVLILWTGAGAPDRLDAIVESLHAEGARVVVRRCEGDYDALLDEVAEADCVMGWK